MQKRTYFVGPFVATYNQTYYYFCTVKLNTNTVPTLGTSNYDLKQPWGNRPEWSVKGGCVKGIIRTSLCVFCCPPLDWNSKNIYSVYLQRTRVYRLHIMLCVIFSVSESFELRNIWNAVSNLSCCAFHSALLVLSRPQPTINICVRIYNLIRYTQQ